MNSFSTFLFVKGGFLSGVARTLDLGGGMRRSNYARTAQADVLAIYADWRSVGQDLRHGLEQARSRAVEYQPTLFDLHKDQ
jgi:hypothetical protein